jgi:hypothetical protein
MANPVSSVDVPLSIFGSWDTELSPPDIPEGASPANNDVAFLPGSVSTRPGLNRVFSAPVDTLGPFSYEKSFVTASGDIKNLYLTMQDGKLWVEDVTNSPGTATLLFQSAGATYASSCTADYQEFIALSDGTHGIDIPLVYDGTNLYRATQDGPGSAPMVISTALPSVQMASTGGSPATTSVTLAQTNNPILVGPPNDRYTIYSGVLMTVSSTSGFSVGQAVSLSGNTNSSLNISYTIIGISGLAIQCVTDFANFEGGTGGTLSGPATTTTMTRFNNVVSVNTTTAHSLQVGFQAQITNAGTTAVGSGIASIVLNNETNTGIATVTTNAAHGLLPNNIVTIAGVSGATAGTITNVAYAGGFVTITTAAAHNLGVGSEVTIAATTATAVNGEWTIATVPSPTTFSFAFDGTVTAPSGTNVVTGYSASDSGTVTYIWPLANVDPAQDYFTVQTAPTATTFTIQLSYTDGTWTGGTVSFAWDGTFFVLSTPTATSFTYQQYGPNAVNSTVGTVTPYGQMSPGLHSCQVCFLLANGTITAPSPPVQFNAAGGQYPIVSNICTGPSNVVGRILLFTGAQGAYYFYIPVPAVVNGLTVSTATQINDNTTTSILLDFSDNTLYAATATSIPGNNLSAQIVLDPCAGFFTYASRLQAWGGRNCVRNLLNMGFQGGSLPATPNTPSGWLGGGSATSLVAGRTGTSTQAVQFSAVYPFNDSIFQSGYLDAYGAPILLPNTQYSWRMLASVGVNYQIVVSISSASTSFSTSITFPAGIATGDWEELTFPSKTPATIPFDMLITINPMGIAAGTYTATIFEAEMIYTAQPYQDNQAWISYADNLQAFDKDTGIIGANDDLSPIRNFGTIRQALYIVTGTGLHETADNDQTEPSGWDVDSVADNCGAFSICSVARNPQGIGSAGKDWMMWNGPDGAQWFGGQKPIKVSQEIQSVWDALPVANSYQCWTKNDEANKRCYFGVPTGSSMQVLVLDYRNIDGGMIAENPPVHISFTGKMIVSDLTRKWTSWTIPAWCGELMYRNIYQPQMVFGCLTPSGAANAYALNPAQYFDDDFGVIPASYTTYFFVSHEMEQALQVGSHRHVYTMVSAFIACEGTWSITPLAASLSNPFPASPSFPGTLTPAFDVDYGINVETTRCAFTIKSAPVSPSLNSYFKLQKLVVNMAPAAWLKTRGSAGGSF